MKKYLVLLALFVPLLVFGANTPQVTNITNSSRLYRTAVYLTAGNSYVIRTYGNTVDTVLHLLNSSNSQVAYNDDCGSNCVSPQINFNSTISFTPTATGNYYILMRHYYSGIVGAVGDMKVFTNGVLSSSMTNLPVGGTRTSIQPWDAYSQTTPIVAWRKLHYYFFNRDKEATGGATANDTVMYLMSSSSITNYDDDSGAGNTSKITKTSGSCSTGCYVLGGAFPFTYSDESEGNAKLIVDVDTRFGDTDYDGLSNGLEGILGTSSLPLGGGDTDQDGLNDFLETVGAGDIALPWEGSSPTQKDVFVEVDYFGRTIAGSYVDFYEDFSADIKNNLKYSFIEHGDIKIHIDVDDNLGVMDDSSTTKGALCKASHFIPDENPNWTINNFYDLENKKSIDFTTARTGIYYWVVAANRHSKEMNTSSGVSCGSTGSGIGTDRIIVSLGNRAGGGTLAEYSGTTVHEMGHAFMLGHNGNGNKYDDVLKFAPNGIIHRSAMNYRWQMGVPENVAGDSAYRYSTDNSTNRPELDWSSGTNGCIVDPWIDNGCTSDINCSAGLTCDIAIGVCRSPKLECINLGDTATSACDCTFNEWVELDLDSAGVMGLGADSEAEDNMQYNERPVFGINGEVIANNIENLITSGAKYTKLTKDSDKMLYFEERKRISESYYTTEIKKNIKKKFLESLIRKGLKEGSDYEIIDGDVIFK